MVFCAGLQKLAQHLVHGWRLMKRFWADERGYVLVLVLIFMPVFIVIGLLVIDIARGNNAHSDHYAAADALALAGARELDGGADSIDRAKAAMANLSNSVSYLGLSGADVNIDLVYEDVAGNTFTVIFLTTIPDSDDEPIDQAFVDANATTDGAAAEYVYVRSRARNLGTFFFNPLTSLRGDVPIAASAVATHRSAACDVTPLFICNPFESQGLDLQAAFAAGQLHGRLIKLHPKGGDTALPGNFGFLQVRGANDTSNASANTIRAIFAGNHNPTCYDSRTVTTKPGAATSIAQGLNVRFDIYAGPFSNSRSAYPPAVNVRKGFVRKATGPNNACNVELTTDLNWAMPFPSNATMSPPGGGVPGAFIGSGNWDIDRYWLVNYQSTLTQAQKDDMNSFPIAQAPGANGPSRYDVYRYEIENDLMSHLSTGNGSGQKRESGLPGCALSASNPPTPVDDPDRRLMFAAIVDCIANGGNGVTTFPVNSYASIFLVSPMQHSPSTGDGTIDIEITDITGFGGNGTLDLFVRDEAILVR